MNHFLATDAPVEMKMTFLAHYETWRFKHYNRSVTKMNTGEEEVVYLCQTIHAQYT